MRKNKVLISIIIVHYNVKEELFNCIKSIFKSNPKIPFEIIVVDNDEIKLIELELKKNFPTVIYIKNINNGWGGGTNKGLKFARGEYVYLLNPDTIIVGKAIDNIYKFALDHKNLGVASSMLLDKKKKIYKLQGTQILTPFNALMALTFLNKLFPNSSFSKKFWIKDWSRRNSMKVEVATLSAALIKKDILVKVGAFDEKYFLYFEEYDLAKRLTQKGYENYIVANSKVIHIWEASAKKTGRTNEFMDESRKYYFRKHYGFVVSQILSYILNLNKHIILFLLILLSSLFLSFYRLNELMMFIGDQGWFYLSAKELIINGKIPLVGITSSHTWINQGPLWTYMLSIILFIFNFTPVAGAYITVFINALSVVLIYRICSEFFTKRLALIASTLYAFSPLVIIHSRMPYHTSPIPFFVLILIYSLIKWRSGSSIYFPISLLSMSILYNFELATVIFWPIIFSFLLYGWFRQKKYVKALLYKRIITYSIFALVFPMIPIFIHDIGHGFNQTVKFGGWIFYKIFQFFGIFDRPMDSHSLGSVLSFFAEKYSLLVFPYNLEVSILIFTFSFLVPLLILLKKGIFSPDAIIYFMTVIGIIGYLVSKTPSEAYLLMLFPGLIILFSLTLSHLLKKSIFLVITVLFLIGFNTWALLKSNYYMNRIYGPTFQERIDAAEEIIKLGKGEEYNLIYKGEGAEFTSSIMNYEYLVWWLSGYELTKSKSINKIEVHEFEGNIEVKKLPQ